MDRTLLNLLSIEEFISLKKSSRWLSLEDFEGEVWKELPDIEEWKEFSDCYLISSYGRVKSKRRYVGIKTNNEKTRKGAWIRERIRKTHSNRYGYETLNLRHYSKNATIKIHRAVAIAFIDNPDNLREINHKNEVKQDNRMNNLEWCTRKYNLMYGNGYKDAPQKRIKSPYFQKLMKSVQQYNMDGRLINTFQSLSDAARAINKPNRPACSDIVNCCKGKAKSAYGYKWKFAEDSAK